MALSFPNSSRSYDLEGARIRFLGHDGLFQIPFFVETDALLDKDGRKPTGEAGYLAAFDAARNSIHEAARRAYSYGRKSMFTLTSKELRG
ncbi:DUF1488 domain-containing protein [Phyllobacterium myrsinacearum]|uniref:DUF1488 domain-containing protein n=1 Tax=Phyllobacterium myrsinacearum TaxID=28101 RepID=A0A839EMI6_9HYPH|nr:DUF1488 domain-containing protein [Phyllobacterium myrsinacearum]MBA8879488.1 hypothetical protein [Phyllobacterium myrsinacearum]